MSVASGSGACGTDQPPLALYLSVPAGTGRSAPALPVSMASSRLARRHDPPVPTACSRGRGPLRAPRVLGGPGQLYRASCWPAGLQDRCPSPECGSAAHQLSTPLGWAAKGKGQGGCLGDSVVRPRALCVLLSGTKWSECLSLEACGLTAGSHPLCDSACPCQVAERWPKEPAVGSQDGRLRWEDPLRAVAGVAWSWQGSAQRCPAGPMAMSSCDLQLLRAGH